MKKLRQMIGPIVLLSMGLLFMHFFTPSILAVPAPTTASLQVTYQSAHTKKPIRDQKVSLYKIGMFEESYSKKFQLADAFKKSEVDIQGKITADEQHELALILSDYIDQEAIQEIISQRTADNGEVTFSSLDFGIYLVRLEATNDSLTKSEPFLIALPMLNNEGTDWLYNVVTEPKTAEEVEEEPPPITVVLEAVKQLDGKNPSGETFQFLLKDQFGNVLQTKENKNQVIRFDAMTYERAGKYYYRLEEWQNPAYDQIIFDDSIYQIEIQIVEEEKKLEAVVNYQKNGEKHQGLPLFNNQTLKEDLPIPGEEPAETGSKKSEQAFSQTGTTTIGLSLFGLLAVFGIVIIKKKEKDE